MKALQYSHQAGLRLVEVPKPDLAGEACIRVLLAGICSTVRSGEMIDSARDIDHTNSRQKG